MLVQPLVARMLLPSLGGAPAVWNTCMVFFQAGLLAGYGYAHLGPRLLGTRLHACLHMLLGLAILTLPWLQLSPPAHPPTSPAVWVLQSLLIGVAAPFVFLASSAPLLQKWCVHLGGKNPYCLYAASNLGSFIGLLCYPLVLERYWPLDEQTQFWRGGLTIFVAMLAGAGFLVIRRRSNEATSAAVITTPPGPRQIGRWVLLALAPSSLMLSITNYLTTDLAPIPFLWVLPLGLYLLTFVIAFSGRASAPLAVATRYLPVVVLLMLFLWLSEATTPLAAVLGLHLLGFFCIAFFCHGELARTKPDADHLTSFYFWLALGGVLGGALNALVAPLLFSSYLEYPLVFILIGLLRPGDAKLHAPSEAKHHPERDGYLRDWLEPMAITGVCLSLVFIFPWFGISPGPIAVAAIFGAPLFWTLLQSRPLRYGLTLAGILFVSGFYSGVQGDVVAQHRTFFGVYRVTREGDLVKLVHGDTVHGVQSLKNPGEPLAYYHRTGPAGDLLTQMRKDPRRHRRPGKRGPGCLRTE